MSIRKRWLLTATFIVTFVSFAVTFGCAPALNVRPKQPFQQRVELILPENTGGQNGFVNVPAGKRLVIEYISGEAFMPQGQKMLFSVICWVSGKKVRHYLGTHAVGSFGAPDYFWSSGPVHFYADPDTVMYLRADRDITKGEAKVRR